jgi:hypothetical protein
MSSEGIPQIAVVMGSCTAGGACVYHLALFRALTTVAVRSVAKPSFHPSVAAHPAFHRPMEHLMVSSFVVRVRMS